MNRYVAGVFLAVFAFALAGCSTMKGLGQDVQGGGQNIQKAAS